MLNKVQRIILSVGILLVVTSGLFLPYEGEVSREGDNPKIYMGHYFLFTPPAKPQVFEAYTGKKLDSPFSPQGLRQFSSHIIAPLVWIKISVIVLTTGGFVILFAEKKNTSIEL